jgi:hypothetical protein
MSSQEVATIVNSPILFALAGIGLTVLVAVFPWALLFLYVKVEALFKKTADKED